VNKDSTKDLLSLSAREQPTTCPGENPIGYQRWSNLTFVHWRVPLATIRDLVPDTLEIDTFAGDAWIGLVPFYMSQVRPRRLPAIPWLSNFCETNLRTYVHRDGRDPGVWFFSLDAARVIPVWIARAKWNLNYHWARMRLSRQANQIEYSSCRFARDSKMQGDAARAKIQIQVEIGERIATEHDDAWRTSLEFFLAERYLMYTVDRQNQLLRGQVYHTPYPLSSCRLTCCEQAITDGAGISVNGSPCHTAFSSGVNVKIFPLRPVS
jgi:uncharacterized protein YqjF (DUF2071 family)